MISKRQIYYLLPASLRFFVRRIYFLPVDTWTYITGKGNRMIPPKGLIFIGSGDFRKTGEHYLEVFKNYCNLVPNQKVLDVGCGIGRIAVPLVEYLDNNGSYDGFDIVKMGIDWCKKNISKDHPNFRFIHIDLKNDLYNKTGEFAKYFRFPYPDSRFDLVILTSVFTHMMPEDVENYVKEIRRVLNPGGKCLATFFILNSESRSYMKQNPSFCFNYHFGNYSLMDQKVKEANIAYDESYLVEMMRKNQLSIEKVLYGFWSGRPEKESFDFQDTMIVCKEDISAMNKG